MVEPPVVERGRLQGRCDGRVRLETSLEGRPFVVVAVDPDEHSVVVVRGEVRLLPRDGHAGSMR
ncbi:hypothetical protein C488_03851 [Natrinema pellirubrum DSM 15624]|uniref:Uncharacterized protein n=1 Tax=Natrinema pellirubrum (strain DSM 15624 / CIP 106293 / JCM 10476 / NCIMB 786 / 157) TaxID=797303 RepID=L9Z3D7_NATP1|nr:hypothetical protein C488_03851 [Natrinema pellirubrum DSM 15624]